jgi:REP element-mobilizing transposase RayT
MARRSRQLELPTPRTWGGARRGAGRPPIDGRRPTVPHRSRPEHDPHHPVHVTIRAKRGNRSLRAARPFAAVYVAIAAASNDGFRVIHFSVQDDHIHLIVEAQDKVTLWRGITGLKIRTARALNRALNRAGSIWNGKYHARALRTPRETRTALLYVLQNWKKHIPGAHGIDGRSSGPWFDGWTGVSFVPTTPSPVVRPQTWLAARGWRERGGGTLRRDEQPAAARPAATATAP